MNTKERRKLEKIEASVDKSRVREIPVQQASEALSVPKFTQKTDKT
jgi:hypothetical protein